MPRPVKNDLSATDLRALVLYDPLTGGFTNHRTGNTVGYINSGGYVFVKIGRRPYLAHRLAFLWMTGDWPSSEVDHQNRVRSDNRWENLREANRSQNSHNCTFRATALGARGVRMGRGGRFRAGIMKDGKRVDLGAFDTLDEAKEAYRTAARQLFGIYADAA